VIVVPSLSSSTRAADPPEQLPPTVQELERAWLAVRSGQFRQPQRYEGGSRAWSGQPTQIEATTAAAATGSDPGAGVRLPEPVVVVAGAHGWAGASTTTLMLAEASVRAGTPARVVDTASPLRSGFVAAAVTEHGVDATGKWRVGSRGAVSLQRQAHPQNGVTAAPAPLPVRDGTVSIVDATWSLGDLLDAFERIENRDDNDLETALDRAFDVADLQRDLSGHWLPAAARGAPLVVTARASVPGLRLLEQALESLVGSRPSAVPVVVALLGPRTLPRSLAATAGPRVLAVLETGRLVVIPERPALAQEGLTPAPLPRELQEAADQLLALTGALAAEYVSSAGGRPATEDGRRSPVQHRPVPVRPTHGGPDRGLTVRAVRRRISTAPGHHATVTDRKDELS
jgi:hypothetical protein